MVSRTGHWVPDCTDCCEWFWLESGHQTRSFLGFPLIRHFFLCSLCQKWGTTPGSCSRKKQRTQWKVDFSCFCSHVVWLHKTHKTEWSSPLSLSLLALFAFLYTGSWNGTVTLPLLLVCNPILSYLFVGKSRVPCSGLKGPATSSTGTYKTRLGQRTQFLRPKCKATKVALKDLQKHQDPRRLERLEVVGPTCGSWFFVASFFVGNEMEMRPISGQYRQIFTSHNLWQKVVTGRTLSLVSQVSCSLRSSIQDSWDLCCCRLVDPMAQCLGTKHF